MCVWCQALVHSMALWVERVASEDNVSDLPSRMEYKVMRLLKAEWRAPQLATLFMGNQCFQTLHEYGRVRARC